MAASLKTTFPNFYPQRQTLVVYAALLCLLLLLPCPLLVGAFFTSIGNQDDLMYPVEDLSRDQGSFGIEDYVSSPYGYLTSRYQQNRPVCPTIRRLIWREAVMQQAWPTVVAMVKPVTRTKWHTATETFRFPTTVVSRSTVVLDRDVIVKTDTVCVPKSVVLVTPEILTAMRTISKTSLQTATVTTTNYVTTTKFVAHQVTVSQISSVLHTSIIPTTKHATVWSKKVVTVTQPVYITTELLVKAPELRIVTSTTTEHSYVTTTKFITVVVQKSLCQKQFRTQNY